MRFTEEQIERQRAANELHEMGQRVDEALGEFDSIEELQSRLTALEAENAELRVMTEAGISLLSAVEARLTADDNSGVDHRSLARQVPARAALLRKMIIAARKDDGGEALRTVIDDAARGEGGGATL